MDKKEKTTSNKSFCIKNPTLINQLIESSIKNVDLYTSTLNESKGKLVEESEKIIKDLTGIKEKMNEVIDGYQKHYSQIKEKFQLFNKKMKINGNKEIVNLDLNESEENEFYELITQSSNCCEFIQMTNNLQDIIKNIQQLKEDGYFKDFINQCLEYLKKSSKIKKEDKQEKNQQNEKTDKINTEKIKSNKKRKPDSENNDSECTDVKMTDNDNVNSLLSSNFDEDDKVDNKVENKVVDNKDEIIEKNEVIKSQGNDEDKQKEEEKKSMIAIEKKHSETIINTKSVNSSQMLGRKRKIINDESSIKESETIEKESLAKVEEDKNKKRENEKEKDSTSNSSNNNQNNPNDKTNIYSKSLRKTPPLNDDAELKGRNNYYKYYENSFVITKYNKLKSDSDNIDFSLESSEYDPSVVGPIQLEPTDNLNDIKILYNINFHSVKDALKKNTEKNKSQYLIQNLEKCIHTRTLYFSEFDMKEKTQKFNFEYLCKDNNLIEGADNFENVKLVLIRKDKQHIHNLVKSCENFFKVYLKRKDINGNTMFKGVINCSFEKFQNYFTTGLKSFECLNGVQIEVYLFKWDLFADSDLDMDKTNLIREELKKLKDIYLALNMLRVCEKKRKLLLTPS
jgi:hypothetical protein